VRAAGRPGSAAYSSAQASACGWTETEELLGPQWATNSGLVVDWMWCTRGFTGRMGGGGGAQLQPAYKLLTGILQGSKGEGRHRWSTAGLFVGTCLDAHSFREW
jgi:hypothetical protein